MLVKGATCGGIELLVNIGWGNVSIGSSNVNIGLGNFNIYSGNINIGSGNGLLLKGTKPLTEQPLTFD